MSTTATANKQRTRHYQTIHSYMLILTSTLSLHAGLLAFYTQINVCTDKLAVRRIGLSIRKCTCKSKHRSIHIYKKRKKKSVIYVKCARNRKALASVMPIVAQNERLYSHESF